MGCGGTKEKATPSEGDCIKDEDHSDEEQPSGSVAVVVTAHPKEETPGQPSSFDGLVMCTLAALLRLCDQLETTKCQDLVVQANKLLDIISGANCPQAWEMYLRSRAVRDATFEIIQLLTTVLQDPKATLMEVKTLIEKHAYLWESVNQAGMKVDRPIAPLQEIMDHLSCETELSEMDEDDMQELQRMVHDAWIEIGVLTLAHYAHSTAKHVAKTINAAACGEIGTVTLKAVLRGESVVSSELEAMWGELTLMRHTVRALENQHSTAQDKAKKTLTVLQMSKTQARTVEILVQSVRCAKKGERVTIFGDTSSLQAVGYLLVELHCRGYANGAAIVQRAIVLLGQILDAGQPLSGALKVKLDSIHIRLETLRRFLSVDVKGAAALEEQLVQLQAPTGIDKKTSASAANGLRAVVAERARMLAVQPVQRAETVLANPWELGSNSEYGHLNLLYRILTEAEKLDVAEHHPNIGDVHLPASALKSVVNRIESLKWEKGQLYEKVQGTLGLLEIFNTAQRVVAGDAEPADLEKAYSDKINDIDMEYVTSCGGSLVNEESMHPVESVCNTISRIQRGKSSIEKLGLQLVVAWPALYDLIVDGLAMASANRITQMFDATIKGSIGVNNLMVLLRSERAMLNELQAEMMGLLSWTELNEKLNIACSNHSGAYELHDAAAAISASLDRSKLDEARAKASLESLRVLCKTGQEFLQYKSFNQASQQAILSASKVLIEQRVAGYRANELAQMVVSLELKSVRQNDLDGIKGVMDNLRIKSTECDHIGRLLITIQDFQEAVGPVEVSSDLELQMQSQTMRKSTAVHKEHQDKLRAVQTAWLEERKVDVQCRRLGLCLKGDMPDSAADYYKDSLRVAFLELDRDHDGSITMEELQAWLQSSVWQDMPPVLRELNAGSDASEIKKVFEAIDANGDGVISFDEFRSVLENEIDESVNPKGREEDEDADLYEEMPSPAGLPTMQVDMDLHVEEGEPAEAVAMPTMQPAAPAPAGVVEV
eukprot:TRINITY_DN16067_c0_g4_i1.p1 TRINITY_DN16067_c0_g4~~TRINITY_DN16067_c0_g4_i1.p1  ORF type:complete len:1002 (-),score=296.93 TRINITY_DN16067_c0_g4_i1:190-3195(-)